MEALEAVGEIILWLVSRRVWQRHYRSAAKRAAASGRTSGRASLPHGHVVGLVEIEGGLPSIDIFTVLTDELRVQLADLGNPVDGFTFNVVRVSSLLEPCVPPAVQDRDRGRSVSSALNPAVLRRGVHRLADWSISRLSRAPCRHDIGTMPALDLCRLWEYPRPPPRSATVM